MPRLNGAWLTLTGIKIQVKSKSQAYSLPPHPTAAKQLGKGQEQKGLTQERNTRTDRRTAFLLFNWEND